VSISHSIKDKRLKHLWPISTGEDFTHIFEAFFVTAASTPRRPAVLRRPILSTVSFAGICTPLTDSGSELLAVIGPLVKSTLSCQIEGGIQIATGFLSGISGLADNEWLEGCKVKCRKLSFAAEIWTLLSLQEKHSRFECGSSYLIVAFGLLYYL